MNTMNKITKAEYYKFRRMNNAVNNSARYLAELQAHLQLLQRIGDVDEIEDLNLRLLDFLTEVSSKFENTLQDNE